MKKETPDVEIARLFLSVLFKIAPVRVNGRLVELFVEGTPQTAGSKTPCLNRRTGKLYTRESGSNASLQAKKDYRIELAARAQEQRVGALFSGALAILVVFVMRRPNGHFVASDRARGLKVGVPALHTARPDATKLLRAAEDALSGAIWKDDSNIAIQQVIKPYGARTGTYLAAWELEDGVFLPYTISGYDAE